ncbi:Phox homologous domain-containing protein [Aspergillus coremiiformis]|uniref:Endosomal/vacuolar adapter protein YPT35 n=1 Tax=Aspergillus coremiiformis TaxID=138285 RepID=A0A5N6YWS1_9EURO|nr:Phox homologous domain-containing protein [Aspergillus coremiiformis]
MERANEETSLSSLLSRPQLLPSPSTASPKVSDADALVTTSLATGIGVNNGTIFPQAHNGYPKDRPISGIVPPYWSHHRNASRASQISLEQPAITLEDHTEDPDSDTSRGLWARSVSVDDHIVVQGKSGIGAYVVWSCTIQTLEGGPITVRMRFSEFDDLRQRLVSSFPHAKNALPALPPKSVLFKFRPAFLESRREGLEYFMNCILLNPEFSSSPIVKDFLFGRMC